MMVAKLVLACLIFSCAKADQEVPLTINAMDSDYLHMEIRSTQLPYPVGRGVFAKFDIGAGEILCEHRGPVIPKEALAYYHSDKLFEIELTQNGVRRPYCIVGEGVCAYINDCANILGKEYSKADLEELQYNESSEIQTYPGYEYNAHVAKTALGKIFIVSMKEIKANSEIFFSYGKDYWIPRLEELMHRKEETRLIQTGQ